MNVTTESSWLSTNSMFGCSVHACNPIDLFYGAPRTVFAAAVLLIVFFPSKSALERAPSLSRGKTVLSFVTALLAVMGLFYMTPTPVASDIPTPGHTVDLELEEILLPFASVAWAMVAALIVHFLIRCVQQLQRRRSISKTKRKHIPTNPSLEQPVALNGPAAKYDREEIKRSNRRHRTCEPEQSIREFQETKK